MSTMFRDPFPIEKYENDNTFGNREKHRHVIGKEDPFRRLAYTHTLQSERRTRAYHDPQAPRDSLDFAIKTTHVPWKFNASKNEVLLQKETVGIDTGRKLKNRTVEEKLAFDPADPPIRTVICKQKWKNYCFANTDARDSLLFVCQAVNKLFSATATI